MKDSDFIIYNTPDGKAKVSLYERDGNIWLNQKLENQTQNNQEGVSKLERTTMTNKQMQFLIYNAVDENLSINAIIKDETIWLTQKAMA